MEEKREEGVILGAQSTLRSDNIAISRHAYSHRFEQDFCKKITDTCFVKAMYKCLLDICPHPKSKYHFQALRTLVLAHHMQVASQQSFHLELHSFLLFCALLVLSILHWQMLSKVFNTNFTSFVCFIPLSILHSSHIGYIDPIHISHIIGHIGHTCRI